MWRRAACTSGVSSRPAALARWVARRTPHAGQSRGQRQAVAALTTRCQQLLAAAQPRPPPCPQVKTGVNTRVPVVYKVHYLRSIQTRVYNGGAGRGPPGGAPGDGQAICCRSASCVCAPFWLLRQCMHTYCRAVERGLTARDVAGAVQLAPRAPCRAPKACATRSLPVRPRLAPRLTQGGRPAPAGTLDVTLTNEGRKPYNLAGPQLLLTVGDAAPAGFSERRGRCGLAGGALQGRRLGPLRPGDSQAPRRHCRPVPRTCWHRLCL
jgi:hypothetical protein